MSKKGYISIREYARRRGCSDTAVHKAWKEGHIQDSAFAWNAKLTKKLGIYADMADEQWSLTLDPSRTKNEALANNILNKKGKEPSPKSPPKQPKYKDGKLPNVDSNAPSTADAKRVEAVYKAKLRELEYKKKVGELIEKDAVYNSLFAAGQELRDAMLSIPDRIIDEVLSASNRNEAHELLRKSIHEELERITEIEQRPVA